MSDVGKVQNTSNIETDRDRLISEHQGQKKEEDPNAKRDGMSFKHVAAYSVGHFNNDLCAAMWFVYLSWYLNKVVKLDADTTGTCLFSGQIADGIMTPIVGLLSDKITTRCG